MSDYDIVMERVIDLINHHERKYPVHYIIMSEYTKILFETATRNLVVGTGVFKTIYGKQIAINNDIPKGEVKLATIMIEL